MGYVTVWILPGLLYSNDTELKDASKSRDGGYDYDFCYLNNILKNNLVRRNGVTDKL